MRVFSGRVGDRTRNGFADNPARVARRAARIRDATVRLQTPIGSAAALRKCEGETPMRRLKACVKADEEA